MHVCISYDMWHSLVGGEVTQPSLSLYDGLGGPDAGILQRLSHMFLLFPFAVSSHDTCALRARIWSPLEHKTQNCDQECLC